MHAPLAFVIATVPMIFTAAAFAELGTRMPVAASEAAYVEAAFDRRYFTIAVGLVVVATAIVSAATISAGGAGYISVFLDLPRPWILVGLVVAMGIVAGLATRQAVMVAGVMTIVEIGGLLLILGSGAWQRGDIVTRMPEMLPALSDAAAWTGLAGASLVAVFAFIGFEHLVNVAEEMKSPRRTLPRALFVTLGVTATLYLLVVWVSVIAVPPERLAASPAPLAMVFRELTGLPLSTMSAIAIVAALNGIVVHMIMISRVLYGMADRGHLPRWLARVSPRTATPLVATALGVGAILVLALAVPLAGLADFTARLTLVIFAIVNLALIRLKLKGDPTPPDIFVCPMWVAVAGLLSSIALLLLDRLQ